MHVIANSQMVLKQFSDWINTCKNRALFVAYPSLPHLNNTSCSLFTTKYLSALFGPFFYSIKQLLQKKNSNSLRQRWWIVGLVKILPQYFLHFLLLLQDLKRFSPLNKWTTNMNLNLKNTWVRSLLRLHKVQPALLWLLCKAVSAKTVWRIWFLESKDRSTCILQGHMGSFSWVMLTALAWNFFFFHS